MSGLKKAVGVMLILAGVVTGGVPAVAADTVTIAVVRDGPGDQEQFIRDVETELRQLVREEVEIRFDAGPRYSADWDADRAAAIIRNALSAPDVDMILGVGAMVTFTAAAPDVPLTRPFVGTYAFYADTPGLPVENGRSLKPGFNAIVLDQRASSAIDAFHELIPFDTLYTGFSNEARMGDKIVAYGQSIGVKMVPVNIPGDIDQALGALPEHVEALLLMPMYRISEQQRRDLIEGLTARRIPTFSLEGHQDVELGALAAVIPDFTKQRVRRVALNLSRLIAGDPTENLPVTLSVEPRLLINGRTAATVGYEPSIRVRNLASFIHADELGQAPALTFAGALDLAEETNVSLAIADAELESSLRQKQRARSPMLPQVLTQAAYAGSKLTIDTPLFPEKLATAGVTVNQMIYDDRTVTNFRSSGRLYEGSQHEREAQRLDVMADAGSAFLQFVVAKVLQRVSANNVRLTEDNLELSRVRFSAGYSGRDEVLRWESVLASRRSELLQRGADVETARIALNQVLGVEQGRRWQPQEIDVDTEVRNFWLGRVGPVFDNAERARKFVEALVDFAVENAPELMALDLAADAIDIQVSQRKRSFILPSFVASFSYDYIIDRSPAPPPGARSDNYNFQIAAIYPLFSGGDKYYDMRLQQSQLEAVKGEREFARQRIEQRTRTAIHRAGSSFSIIDLARRAADNSQQNLDIVQDKYAQGIVNVTDLLSAQNDFFIADQNAQASVYSFLIDLVEVQRSIAWFEEDKTPEEQETFFEHIREAVVPQ